MFTFRKFRTMDEGLRITKMAYAAATEDECRPYRIGPLVSGRRSGAVVRRPSAIQGGD